ncbi:MAG: hypothetical protein WCW52_00645 [Elusimicrobiales bacterium]|jgi:hypothetical protein
MKETKKNGFKKKIPVPALIAAFILVPGPASPLFAAFEDTGLGARMRGLGDSASALDDVGGAVLNPALPGFARKFETGAHFEAGTRSSLGPLDSDSYAFDAALPRRSYGKLGTMSVIGRYRTAGDGITEKSFSLGYATWQLKKASSGVLDLGGNLKFMRLASAASADSTMALGLDFGALWRINTRSSLGLSVLNINSPSFKSGALDDKAPLAVRLGAAEKTEDYALTLDLASRSGAGGRKSGYSLNTGFEYLWRTYRYGIFSSRTGLSLAEKASFASLGVGYRRPAAELSYALLLPVTGTIVPGHAVSLCVRFGDKDLETEYERLIKQEIKYRKDLVEALDESSRREGRLRDELEDLKGEIDKLSASLKTALEQKAEVSRARERLEAIVERQRRAEAELRSLEEKRRNDKLALEEKDRQDKLDRLRSDFAREWADYLRMRSGGAPKELLKGALQRLISQYQSSGIDISPATVELQGLIAR